MGNRQQIIIADVFFLFFRERAEQNNQLVLSKQVNHI